MAGIKLALGLACISLISCTTAATGGATAGDGSGMDLPGTPAVSAPELRSRYIAGFDDVPLNVVEAGDPTRPALVFIHGLGQSHLSWEYQLRSELAKNYHLVAYDLRGHGNSGKPSLVKDYAGPDVWAGDLERVLSATGARDPILVSWSYGTWVAVDYLSSHNPDVIAGLVLVGGSGGLVQSTSTATEKQASEGARLARLNDSGWLGDSFARGEGINAFFIRREVDPIWSQRTAAANVLLPPYARRHILQRSFDNSDAFDRVTMPTLIVVGSEDVTISVEDAARLKRRLNKASLEVFEGSGHLPFAEEPVRFNRLLARFAHSFINER